MAVLIALRGRRGDSESDEFEELGPSRCSGRGVGGAEDRNTGGNLDF